VCVAVCVADSVPVCVAVCVAVCIALRVAIYARVTPLFCHTLWKQSNLFHIYEEVPFFFPISHTPARRHHHATAPNAGTTRTRNVVAGPPSHSQPRASRRRGTTVTTYSPVGMSIESQRTLQHTATHCNTLQHTATHCNTLQHTATQQRASRRRGTKVTMYGPVDMSRVSPRTLQHTAAHCNILQHTATHCNILQYTATRCNTLQHPATHPAAQPRASRRRSTSVTMYNSIDMSLVRQRTLQHTATHCDTMQHTATHRNTQLPWTILSTCPTYVK